MQEEYGDQYINLRQYMITMGMSDAGLEPTEADIERIAEGLVPASLLVDDMVHFNAMGYTLIGNLVYERMYELGYFGEIIMAIEEACQPYSQ